MIVGKRDGFYSSIGHRAYGPKEDVHAGRPLVCIPPDRFDDLESLGLIPPGSLTTSHKETRRVYKQQQQQQNRVVQYHSLADSYPPLDRSRQAKIAPGQVLPMKILDKSEVTAKITV